MTKLRCISNMDGSLYLTIGKLYEVLSTKVAGMVIVRNDDGEVMGYPVIYFADSKIDFSHIKHMPVEVDDGFVKPIYRLGDVLDVRYINDGLPNRILVTGYRRTTESKQWVYTVILENTGNTVEMNEEWLAKRVKKKDAPVYRHPSIVARYNSGMHWVGNYTPDVAYAKREAILQNNMAEKVFVREALDREGNVIEPSKRLSVWIKYKNPIGIAGVGKILDRNAARSDCGTSRSQYKRTKTKAVPDGARHNNCR